MSGHVAHHFDDYAQQRQSAELGMWGFLASEALFFSGLFLGYAQYRHWYPETFSAGSSRLDVWLGALNTGVLLTSSLTMALAVHAAGKHAQRRAWRLLMATALLAAAFLGIKATEYRSEFEHHKFPGPAFRWEGAETGEEASAGVLAARAELFFGFYFAMTGLHAAHMVVGLGLLSWLILQTYRGRFLGLDATPVEMVGLYWHFVDVVWVFLFPLLYLAH